MQRPATSDYASFYETYVKQVKEDDVHLAFQNNSVLLDSFLDTVPESKGDYAYAEGKWTVKQLLQHVIDAERIFTHRALWFARKSPHPLSGFDENEYAAVADVSNRSVSSLVTEMKAVRRSSELLFRSFAEKELNAVGVANNHAITVNALGFVLLGHFLHHQQILEERYV